MPPTRTWRASPRSGSRHRTCSTRSWPAGWPGSPASGSDRSSSNCWGCRWRRGTAPPTGRVARCPRTGSSTPRSTSRCSSSCATCWPGCWRSRASSSGRRRSSRPSAPPLPRRPAPSRGGACRGSTSCASRGCSPTPERCGRRATGWPRSATSPPGGSCPTPRSSRRRPRHPSRRRHSAPCPPSAAAPSAGSPPTGSPP